MHKGVHLTLSVTALPLAQARGEQVVGAQAVVPTPASAGEEGSHDGGVTTRLDVALGGQRQ